MGKILVRQPRGLPIYTTFMFWNREQLQDGAKNVPVGKVIALLAEEGDDISNLQPPKEEKPAPKQEASSSTTPRSEPPKPTPETSAPLPPQSHSSAHVSHSRPLFPSVHRLLLEFNVTNPEEIKGTGVRGMLTKGDVLAFLGKASSPQGTYKEAPAPQEAAKVEKKPEIKVSYFLAFSIPIHVSNIYLSPWMDLQFANSSSLRC